MIEVVLNMKGIASISEVLLPQETGHFADNGNHLFLDSAITLEHFYKPIDSQKCPFYHRFVE